MIASEERIEQIVSVERMVSNNCDSSVVGGERLPTQYVQRGISACANKEQGTFFDRRWDSIYFLDEQRRRDRNLFT